MGQNLAKCGVIAAARRLVAPDVAGLGGTAHNVVRNAMLLSAANNSHGECVVCAVLSGSTRTIANRRRDCRASTRQFQQSVG